MSSIWTTLPDGRVEIKMILDRNGDRMVMEAIHEAVHEVASKFAHDNMDKIMAAVDIKGLGNLIAIYASKELVKAAKVAE